MEFWLIKNGEKEGPIEDYEVRSRIRSGELTGEKKVWYSEIEEWTPLKEAPFFAKEFEIKEVPVEVINEPPPIPPMSSDLHVWSRFGARWLDFLFYHAAACAVILLAGTDPFTLAKEQPFFPFIFVLPWIFFEAFGIAQWGTTLGKWLAGLRVENAEGQKLSAMSAIVRSFRVMILGMGFAQPFLLLICHGVSIFLATKKKIVLWDQSAGTQVRAVSRSSPKWVIYGMTVFLLLILNMALMVPMMKRMPRENFTPEQHRQFEILFPTEKTEQPQS